MANNFLFWLIFAAVVFTLIYIDLNVTKHGSGKVGIKRGLIWSGIWISTAFLFNLGIYLFHSDGHTKALEFMAGYLIEESLSVDNIFVFILIFKIMDLGPSQQPTVLKWGILSAIVMRVAFILTGVALINYFQPVIYVFGAVLFYAAYKMAFGGEEKINLETNPLIKYVSRHFNVKANYKGKKFFIKENNKKFVTPMFLTLILIESSDLVFAVDSIPAVIAITKDPFIIITSNIFAILGLRALYFAIAGIIDVFVYLKYGVAVILFFVGVKMMLSEFIHIPTEYSLLVIISCLVFSIVLSLIFPTKASEKNMPPL